MPEEKREVYLTFDDGPIPEVTEFVLDTLKQYEAKGTFFCLGKNVAAHPGLYKRILNEGHAVGNHTHNHLNGWKVPSDEYLEDVRLAEAHIQSPLFRPPYGRIRNAQADAIGKKYRVVMWDVLSYDFNKEISPERCLKNVTENTRNGSIVVFHDSVKAWQNLNYTLPRCLDYFKTSGMSFGLIEH